MRGGVPISRGTLFHMLRNRLYLGEIVHKDKSHPGQHEAIVEAELFAAVQARLSKNSVTRRDRTTSRAPLTGLLFDATGHRMSPTHARGRSGQRYLYYVSAPLLSGEVAPAAMVRRIAARAIEDLVLDRLRRWSGRPHEGWAMFLPWVRRIELHRRLVLVDLQLPSHEEWSDEVRAPEAAATLPGGILRIAVPAMIRTRGGGTWLIEGAGGPRKARPDRALIAGLRRAHVEMKERGIDLTDPRPDFSCARGMGDPYLRKLSTLAFLAPDIQRAILKGRQPSGLTLSQLLSADLPLDWSRQRAMFGFDQAT